MSAAAQALAAYLGALKLEPKLPFHLWAEANIKNPDGSPFRFRPYQRVPAADMFNARVGSVVLRQYSGAGKTFLFSVGYAYAVTQLKLSIGKMFPAENLSKDWLRKKLMPILRETISERMVVDNLLYKEFENGSIIQGVGANSGGVIRTLEVDIADADEIDAIEQTLTDEGDKLATFLRRTRGRKRQHHWLSSYPSIKGHSKVDARYDVSDGCRWFFECPLCGSPQYFDTPNVVYPAGRPEKAQMQCPGCSGVFDDADRRASSLETGHWVNRDGETVEPGDLPAEKYGRRRGLHLNCTAHVGDHADKFGGYLHEIAAGIESWKSADNPEKARREFDNTMRAKSFESKFADATDAGALEAGRVHVEEGAPLPEDVVAIYCGMDLNKNFIAVQVCGWGDGKIYPLLYEEYKGSWDRPSTWQPLRQLMRRTWTHPNGQQLRIRRACWDSRFNPDTVYAYARPFGPRVICVKGSPTKGAPPIAKVQPDKKLGVRTMTVGSAELKALIYDWISDGIETRTQVIFSDAKDADGFDYFDGAYFAGLTSEERSEEPHGGRMVAVFYHDRRVRNEPLDTMAYSLAASKADRFDYARFKADLDAQAGQKEPKTAAPKRSNYLGQGRGSWL